MSRRRRTGATAAAVLPAALAGAALVAAPFAGTTTEPLANSTTQANSTPQANSTAMHGIAMHRPEVRTGMHLDVPAGSIAVMACAEMALLGVGAGVIVVVRRRHAPQH